MPKLYPVPKDMLKKGTKVYTIQNGIRFSTEWQGGDGLVVSRNGVDVLALSGFAKECAIEAGDPSPRPERNGWNVCFILEDGKEIMLGELRRRGNVVAAESVKPVVTAVPAPESIRLVVEDVPDERDAMIAALKAELLSTHSSVAALEAKVAALEAKVADRDARAQAAVKCIIGAV